MDNLDRKKLSRTKMNQINYLILVLKMHYPINNYKTVESHLRKIVPTHYMTCI